MKTCSKCGIDKLISEFYPKRGQCKACVIARCRTYYRNNTEKRREYEESRRVARRAYRVKAGDKHNKKYPERARARWMLNNWVRLGHVIRPTACPHCGRADVVVEGHHESYDRPLDVTWACRTCHRRLEGRLVE